MRTKGASCAFKLKKYTFPQEEKFSTTAAQTVGKRTIYLQTTNCIKFSTGEKL